MGVKKNKDVTMVTCSSGVTVRIRPISLKLLEQFDLNHVAPEPPMIEAQTIGGLTEMVPDLDDPAYKLALDAHSKKTGDDLINMLTDLGLDVELPADNSWMRSLKRCGIAVPDDPDDQRLLYIQTVMMPDFTNDFKMVAQAVLALSGAPEEAIKGMEDMFRSEVAG